MTAALTPLQSIYLATLLPSPVPRFSNYQRGSVSAGTLAGLRAHARVMASRGMLSPEELAFSQQENLVFRSPAAPPGGALTQDVALETSDAVAARMVPPLIRAAVAVGGDEGASDGGGEDAVEEEESSRDGGALGVSGGVRPATLRLGGSI